MMNAWTIIDIDMKKYYVEVIKVFGIYSGTNKMNKHVSGNPMFFVKERNKFKKDKTIDVFGYGATTADEVMNEMNKAIAYCNKLNGNENE